MQLGHLPRIKLTELPTPLEEMPRLTQALGGPRLLVKRDDLTAVGLGGNKVRKLEFLLADAQNQGATAVITTGGPQTNHGRITIAAAVKLGMKPALVVMGNEPVAVTGNLLLDHIMGAEIHYVPPLRDKNLSAYDKWKTHMDNLENKVEEVAENYRKRGETPYIIKLGGTSVLGTMGYLDASVEVLSQLNAQRIKADYLICGVGTGGTFAGLLLGMKLLNCDMKVIGISVTAKEYMLKPLVQFEASEAAAFLNITTEIREEEITIYDGYVGTSYGHPTREGTEAIKRVAKTEGIILDPVYTGKTMAGLIDLTIQGAFTNNDTVIFLHSGGVPGLFAEEQKNALAESSP
jgi:D-cysteine desulfhydrase family pyridoxal phosphate-dependent enzyme